MALLRPAVMRSGSLLTSVIRTLGGHHGRTDSDLGYVKTLESVASEQQKNRASDLGESFMRKRRSAILRVPDPQNGFHVPKTQSRHLSTAST